MTTALAGNICAEYTLIAAALASTSHGKCKGQITVDLPSAQQYVFKTLTHINISIKLNVSNLLRCSTSVA